MGGRTFGYRVFPAPAGVPEPTLRPDERVYVWQWGRSQRTESGRATVVAGAAAPAAADQQPAPAAAQQPAAAAPSKRQPESLCRQKRLQRQKESSQAPGWQPQVDRADQGRSTVLYADGTTADVRNGRITRVVEATLAAPKVIITPDTDTWRQLARSQLDPAEDALDLGCSSGGGTAVIAEHCRSVVGVDIGRDVLERAAAAVPAARFECFDVLRHPERLASAAAGRSVVFADIGGNRELEALATLLPLLEALPSVRLIVVKSKSLYKGALEWRANLQQEGCQEIGPELEPEPEPEPELEPEAAAAAAAARHARLVQLCSPMVGAGEVGAIVPDGTGFIRSLAALACSREARQSRARQARADRVALRLRSESPERARAKTLARTIISRALTQQGAPAPGFEHDEGSAVAIEAAQRSELVAHLRTSTDLQTLSLFAEWKRAGVHLVRVPPCLFDEEFQLGTSLRSLSLSRNEMRILPPEIGSLKALTSLDVSRNHLRRLPVEIGELKALEHLDASSNHFRVAGDKKPLAVLQLDALATLPRLSVLDLRRVSKIGEYGKGHAELLSERMGPSVRCLITEQTTPPEKKQHAADRDATLLRSQIEPHATGTLRRRLAMVFGDTTDPSKVEREEVIQRLLAHHDADAGGARQPLHIKGIPVCDKLCALLKEQMDIWVEGDIIRRRNPKEHRERTNIRAEHYMILSSPLAFSTTDTADPQHVVGIQESTAARRAAAKLLAHRPMWDAAMRVLRTVDDAFADRVTAVAFTKNFVGSPHIDTQNTGPFYGLALGDFVAPGGALCVEQSAREVAYVDTRHRLGMVDGRFPHWVAPYEGNRYSAIFYQTRGEEVPRTTATFGSKPQVKDPSTYPRKEDNYYNCYCKETQTYNPPWY